MLIDARNARAEEIAKYSVEVEKIIGEEGKRNDTGTLHDTGG